MLEAFWVSLGEVVGLGSIDREIEELPFIRNLVPDGFGVAFAGGFVAGPFPGVLVVPMAFIAFEYWHERLSF